MNDDLRQEVLALVAEDLRVRQDLLDQGVLHDGYHPRMEAVHRRNAARLAALLDEHGWLTPALVGADGAEAAWLIAQHAIGEPDLQRRCLALLRDAAASGAVPARQAATLEDRIRKFEGRPQRYGTQLEADADGRARPYTIEDPENVDERRRAVGLEPLAERLAREPPIPPPADPERFDREYEEWLRRTGWRSA